MNKSSAAIGETSSEPVIDDTDLAANDNVGDLTSVDSAADSMTLSSGHINDINNNCLLYPIIGPNNKRKLNEQLLPINILRIIVNILQS